MSFSHAALSAATLPIPCIAAHIDGLPSDVLRARAVDTCHSLSVESVHLCAVINTHSVNFRMSPSCRASSTLSLHPLN